MNLFSLSDISYSYGNKKVLSHVSIDIAEGELTVIAGSNGIGKSTLLKIIAGLIMPDSGSIIKQKDQKIAYVAQTGVDASFTIPISVGEFVTSQNSKTHKKHSEQCNYNSLEDCLSHVGLKDEIDTPLDELSGGQKQRALIARALMLDPTILLLDEPTAGVDSHMQDQFYELITHFNTVHKLSTIMITHDPQRQYTFGDHVIYLSEKLTSELENSIRKNFLQKKITIIQQP